MYQNQKDVKVSDQAANDYELFKSFAGNDLNRWKELTGQKAIHAEYGPGLVCKVWKSKVLFMKIAFDRFPTDEHEFMVGAFKKNLRLVLSEDFRNKLLLRMEDAQKERAQSAIQRDEEAVSLKDFQRLKAKYKLSEFVDPSPLSPLYRILLELEMTRVISRKDQNWLVSNGLGVFVARYLEHQFKLSGDGWDLVRASSLWREEEFPQLALKATRGFSTEDAKLMAAIHVTRGAAFRDTGKLEEAEKLANEALRINPDCGQYAYNLLGAVRYGMGAPKEGDINFAKAGSTKQQQDASIRKVMEVSEEDERRTVAKYLLEKDPMRYEWAKVYVEDSD